MSTYYVSSVAGDGGAATTWATADLTIEAAIALATSPGDIILVDSAHSESPATPVWNATTRIAIITVDRNGSTTTGHNGWTTGAVVTVSGATSAFTMISSGSQHIFMQGIRINGSTGSSAANDISIGVQTGSVNYSLVCESCIFAIQGSSASAQMSFGANGSATINQQFFKLKNCQFLLKNSTTGTPPILLGAAEIEIVNCTIGFLGGSKPTACFGFNSGTAQNITFKSCDLAGYDTSGGALFTVDGLRGGSCRLRDCKISGTPSFVTGTFPTSGGFIQGENVDSGDTKHIFFKYQREGTVLVSTSVYTDGGEQYQGDTRLSWQIVTTADCNEHEYFSVPDMRIPITAAASKTVRLELVSATTLTDRECWMNVTFVDSASFPLGDELSTRNATPFEGSASNIASSSVAWTGAGGLTKQKLEKAITPDEKCWVVVELCIGRASTTLYADPAPYLD